MEVKVIRRTQMFPAKTPSIKFRQGSTGTELKLTNGRLVFCFLGISVHTILSNYTIMSEFRVLNTRQTPMATENTYFPHPVLRIFTPVPREHLYRGTAYTVLSTGTVTLERTQINI